MAYSAYLSEHVQTELTKAISVAAIKTPEDPIEYLGKYLLKIVADDAQKKKRKEEHTQWEKEDQELESMRKEKELLKQKKEEQIQMNKLKNEELYAQLSKCVSKTEAMKLWTEYIQNETQSVSVYIGSPCELKENDEAVNGLVYNAVSSEQNQFLLSTTFIQSETKGIVFDLLKEDEVEEEEENGDDETAETQKVQSPKERKRIHIQNVLLPNPYKDKLHFFTYPKVGSFLSFESSIQSYLNSEAIQAELRPQWPRPIEEILAEQKAKEETEKETKTEETEENNDETKEETETEEPKEDTNEEDNDEEKEEVLPDPTQIAVKYIISMDTLGDSHIYDTDTIQFVDENIGKFEDILMKIDVTQYLKQREFEQTFKNALEEYEQKTKAEIETKIAEIETENESNAEEMKIFKKNQYIIETIEPIWSLVCDHKMKPSQSSLIRIIAAFVKLFDNKEDNKLSLINTEMSQFTVVSNAVWDQCINVLKEISSEKVNGYNPSEIQSFDTALFDKLLNGIVCEEIGNEGLAIIVTKLFEFVDSAHKLYKFTQAQQSKEEQKTNEETEATDTAEVTEAEPTDS